MAKAGGACLARSLVITMIQRCICRFIVDDRGQDLVEYALLSGIVGIVGLLVFPQLLDQMTAAYTNTITATESAWEPCPPDPAPCP